MAEFFFNGRSNEYDAAEVRALVNAQAQDMRKRYFGSRFDAALFVVEDEDGDVVACGGVSETPRDAKGLLKSAIRSNNPVIFLEGETLYGVKGEVPDEGVEELIPIGESRLARPGNDCTIGAQSKSPPGRSGSAALRLCARRPASV